LYGYNCRGEAEAFLGERVEWEGGGGETELSEERVELGWVA